MSTKESVLRILSVSREFVSGETISRELGISRAAVNTAVRTLRQEGYEICSATNRGYQLQSVPDLMTQEAVGAQLSDERMKRVQVFEKLDSTNSELMRQALNKAPDGMTIIADEQTGGRGRRGRSFVSMKGSGVYLSYLIRPTEERLRKIRDRGGLIWATLTSWTAVAVSDAIEACCGVRPGIKWVNDLYIGSRKITGILTQMNTEAETGEIESIVIGIGVNVREEISDFPEEIQDRAGSIRSETGQYINRAVLAAEMIRALDRMAEDWPEKQEAYHTAYTEHDIVCGRNIRILSAAGTEYAKAVGIDDDFALLVETEGGERKRIISGDVSIRF